MENAGKDVREEGSPKERHCIVSEALDVTENLDTFVDKVSIPEKKVSLVSGAIQGALEELENISVYESEDEEDCIRFCSKKSSVMQPVPLRSTHTNLYRESSFCKSAADFITTTLPDTTTSKPKVTFQPKITELYTAKARRHAEKPAHGKRDTNQHSENTTARPKTAPIRKRKSSGIKTNVESVKEPIRPKEYWLNTGILDDTQTAAFRKLFSRFDKTQSGGISGAELHAAVKELMPERELTSKEVDLILKEFDIKCTGEIEFDEFLYAMTHPKNYIKLIQDDDIEQLKDEVKAWDTFQSKVLRKKHLNRQFNIMKLKEEDTEQSKIFFKMLQTATKEDSMHEIRHFYVNKIKKLNDHVIHDWSAGQRCIGLSDEDVIRRYENIFKELRDKKLPFLKEKKYIDSPYAKPLQWGLADIKSTVRENHEVQEKLNKERSRAHSAVQCTDMSQKNKMGRSKSLSYGKSRNDTTEEISKGKSTKSKKRPKSGKVSEQAIQRTQSAPDTSSTEKIKQKPRLRTAPLQRLKISEFEATPKAVPLPTFYLGDYPRNFNYDHNAEIRTKAAAILEKYYSDLKKVSATNSKAIYKQLHVEHMRRTLRRHFKDAYLAYSGEYEPFVVSPWIPFPTPSPWIPYPPLAESTNVKNLWT